MSISGFLSWLRIVSSSIGIFLAFYFLSDNLQQSVHVVNFTCVAIIGIISYISHNIFYKSEAKRLGFGDSGTGYQFEVGYANLAFGLAGLAAFILSPGIAAESIIILCYALYFLQTGIFHLRVFLKDRTSNRKLFSMLTTLLIAGMMLFFAVNGLITV